MNDEHDLLSEPALARLRTALALRHARDAEPYEGVRYAAVAALLRVVRGPELLFIRRAEMSGDPWSGHMAFPGGRREPADSSLETTAFRETREELGLALDESLLLGRLDDISPRNRLLPPIIVRPFVVAVRPDVRVSLSGEVAETIWVPVERLLGDALRMEHSITVEGRVLRYPAFNVDGHIIWGMTERVVTQLLPLFRSPGT